jgi:hypothetical protein
MGGAIMGSAEKRNFTGIAEKRLTGLKAVRQGYPAQRQQIAAGRSEIPTLALAQRGVIISHVFAQQARFSPDLNQSLRASMTRTRAHTKRTSPYVRQVISGDDDAHRRRHHLFFLKSIEPPSQRPHAI